MSKKQSVKSESQEPERRQLEPWEVNIVKKNLVDITDDIEFYNCEMKKEKLFLETAPVTYRRQVREIEKRILQLGNVIKEHEEAVKTLNDQLKNGAVIKKTNTETQEE